MLMLLRLLDGIAMNASMLLRKFQAIRQTAGVQHIAVRLDHIVEDGLRSLYKGNFDVSTELEVEIMGSLTTDLGGPKRQFFSQFLQQMPNKLNLVEENNGVVFFTCNTELVVTMLVWGKLLFIVCSMNVSMSTKGNVLLHDWRN